MCWQVRRGSLWRATAKSSARTSRSRPVAMDAMTSSSWRRPATGARASAGACTETSAISAVQRICNMRINILGYLGCTVDALRLLDSRCSGQPHGCSVSIMDRQLRQLRPCTSGYFHYARWGATLLAETLSVGRNMAP